MCRPQGIPRGKPAGQARSFRRILGLRWRLERLEMEKDWAAGVDEEA